jgi:diguanylate cyclase (GGDEF)-like protein/PAS domain S-box-containing protein
MPKDQIRRLFFYSLFLILIGSVSPQWARTETIGFSPDKVIAVIPSDAPPTYFIDKKTGKAAGFAVDATNEIAKRAGLRVDYVFEDGWTDIINLLITGKADIIPDLSVSKERQKDVDFTEPLETFPVSLFVRANHPDLDSMPGTHTVGVIQGSIAFEHLKNRDNLRLITYKSFVEGLFDLLAGRIEAFACPVPTLLGLAQESGVEDQIRVISPPIVEIKRAIGVHKNDPALLKRLNKATVEFVDSPEYHRIYAKWYGKPTPFWTVSKVIILGIAAGAIVVIIMVIWRYFSLLRLTRELSDTINERNKAALELRESENKYRKIFENVQDVFYQTDPNGIITDISPSILRYSGYTREELIGKPIADYYYDPEDRTALLETLRKAGEIVDYEIRVKTKEDRLVIVSVNSHFLFDAAGHPTGVEGSLRDITERKKVTEELQRLNELLACQASTDPLTGIPNRSKFNEALGIEILRSSRFSLPLSLIIFDIDHFKKINDTYGHNAGDSALQYLTGLVAKVIRKHDLFARWGGEEFLIMVTNTGRHGAEIFAERLRLMIENFDIPEVGHLTCSFGVAEFVHDDTDEVLINRADQALYRAKSGGRNRVESMPAPSHRS